jgi:UDP-N-acetylglucosamine:LPS N-acetylglucosamine transferase
MYNILATGRPLLAVATPKAEVARWAERYSCGLAADPDEAEEVVKSVRGVLAAPERLEHMSREARKLAKTYDRLNELRKFVDVIEQAASG